MEMEPKKDRRPLKFKTPEDLKEKIDEYFKNTLEEEWTLTGLALALDTSRQTIQNYEKRDEFFDLIKRAKLMIENGYEKDVKKYGRSGTIFVLKNFGWTDRNETDLTTNGESLQPLLVKFINNEDDRNPPRV